MLLALTFAFALAPAPPTPPLPPGPAAGLTREAVDQARVAAGQAQEAAGQAREAMGQAREAMGQARVATGQARVAMGQARVAAGLGLLRQARNLRYAQRWYEAASVYRRFLVENPEAGKVPEARFWLAASLESDQRWDEAAEAYTSFLTAHPDQRLLGREARLNRIRCWGIRQGHAKDATPGLLAALEDPSLEVQVAAALQLAKCSDRRALGTLEKGLALPSASPACSMALIAMGEKPEKAERQATAAPAAQARFLVIRVREAGKPDTVTIRLALALAQAVGNYLSDAQLRQAQTKGIDLTALTERAASLPKGSVVLSVDDGKSAVTVTVE
jgi:tetratricopeptide (TPR) repeat protein